MHIFKWPLIVIRFMKIRKQLFRIKFLSLIYLSVFFRMIKNFNNIFADKSNKFLFFEEKAPRNSHHGHKDPVGVNLGVSHQTSDDRLGYFSCSYETNLCVREFDFCVVLLFVRTRRRCRFFLMLLTTHRVRWYCCIFI